MPRMPFGPSTDYCTRHNRLFDRRKGPCCPKCMVGTTQATRAGIRQSEPPPIYTIPARDVVPGMLYRFASEANGTGLWASIGHVERYDDGVAIALAFSPNSYTHHYDTVEVTLPGLSPRRGCTCTVPSETPRGYVEDLAPSQHAQGCPVAPVEGLHGGMRLWPAPVAPITHWAPCSTGVGWIGHHAGGREQYFVSRAEEMIHADPGIMAFFNPPAPPAENPTAPGWAPYAELIDLAGRWG